MGQPNLPPDVEQSDPFATFSEFFTDKIMEQLVEWTNKYVEQAGTTTKRAGMAADVQAIIIWVFPFCREDIC